MIKTLAIALLIGSRVAAPSTLRGQDARDEAAPGLPPVVSVVPLPAVSQIAPASTLTTGSTVTSTYGARVVPSVVERPEWLAPARRPAWSPSSAWTMGAATEAYDPTGALPRALVPLDSTTHHDYRWVGAGIGAVMLGLACEAARGSVSVCFGAPGSGLIIGGLVGGLIGGAIGSTIPRGAPDSTAATP